MAGALSTMPMLIVNMGAEMIYVLDQRLKAQNIPHDKSTKGESSGSGRGLAETRNDWDC